jgi:AcrR family transcriptional regulator
LRERTKARRREAIIRAAMTLFAERGFDHATNVDIAEAAEVSTRTVTLYFATKQELALAHFSDFADRLAAALKEPSEGAGTIDVVERWLTDELTRRSDLDTLAHAMFEANPDLAALRNARLSEVIGLAADRIAAERGLASGDVGSRIAAAAAGTVIGELLSSTKPGDVATAMDFLRAGVAALPKD